MACAPVSITRLSRSTHWPQERSRAATPFPISHGDLPKADTILPGAVEVVVGFDADLLGSGDHRSHNRVRLGDVADVQRTVATVVSGLAAFLMLRLREVRQNLPVTPAGIPQRSPVVVVVSMSADVHHGVQGATAAQHFASWPLDPPAIQVQLLRRDVAPVDIGHKQLGPR